MLFRTCIGADKPKTTFRPPLRICRFIRLFHKASSNSRRIRGSTTTEMKLAGFNVSEELGFVLHQPLDTLPSYFESWNECAKSMLQLHHDDRVRDRLDSLPLLDVDRLNGHRQLRLAHLQLVTMVSGYVWCKGDEHVPRKLPRNLAVPFYQVTQKLGLTPGIGPHVAVALCNYQLKDPSGPVTCDNMTMPYFKFVQDYGNDWFFLATIGVELAFASALRPLLACIQAAETNDRAQLRQNLYRIQTTIGDMEIALQRLHERLSPEVFFHQFRPFLAGTTSGLYEQWGGLLLEGVSDVPFRMVGGSAAQAAPLQCLDALLGVEHEPPAGDFLQEMRQYMLPDHRRFIRTIENRSKVRSVVLTNRGGHQDRSDGLTEAYDQCVTALTAFRSRHVQLVTKYIIGPKSRRLRDTRSYQTLDEVGTGGSGIMPFLKGVRDETKECLVEK